MHPLSTARHAAVSTAHARNAARTVAATHQALTGMGAMLLVDLMPGRVRIVWTIAAGIEIHLGLGGTDRTEDQAECYQEFFHASSRRVQRSPIVASS